MPVRENGYARDGALSCINAKSLPSGVLSLTEPRPKSSSYGPTIPKRRRRSQYGMNRRR